MDKNSVFCMHFDYLKNNHFYQVTLRNTINLCCIKEKKENIWHLLCQKKSLLINASLNYQPYTLEHDIH